LADNLILATGGVLPVLASATSPSFELDVVEASQGLSISQAWTVLDRIMIVVDITLNLNNQQYPNVISILEIENEKAMQNGGILRQFLRLIAVTSVRNSLETRYSMGGQETEFNLLELSKGGVIFWLEKNLKDYFCVFYAIFKLFFCMLKIPVPHLRCWNYFKKKIYC
jgi:hypothetical protein